MTKLNLRNLFDGSNVRTNIISNYMGKLWGFISVYLFIPLYIKYLGVEVYGVINFYTVLLSLLLFADAGLSATLSREFARSDDKPYCRNLLYSIERLYLFISLFIVAVLFVFAPFIADHWLNTDAIPKEKIALCIRLMGVGIAFQFFATLHNSGLMGLQKQVLVNTIQVSWSAFRSGLVVVALFFIPDLLTFFYWQIACNIIFFFISRHQLWKQIEFETTPRFDIASLKSVSRFALGMMLMAMVASIGGQLDKIMVSNFVALKQYGYYALAGNLAQMPIILINPLTLAILPVLNKMVHSDLKDDLKMVFHEYAFIISFLSSILGLTLAFYAKDLALAWTGDSEIASNVESVTIVLSIGSVFMANQFMPYLIAISNGHTRTILFLGMTNIVLMLPLLYYFVHQFGFIGAPYPYLFLSISILLLIGYLVLNKFMKGEFYTWLLKDVALPFSVNGSVFFVVWILLKGVSFPYNLMLTIPLSGLVCLGINFWFFSHRFPNQRIVKLVKGFLK